MPEFIRGMDLCAQFHDDVVAPLMREHYPAITYSAARLGGGSDVLGFDTERSRDHDWGPQLDIFLTPETHARYGGEMYQMFAHNLPFRYKGYSTHFQNNYLMGDTDIYPLIHRVKNHTVDTFFQEYIGLNPLVGMNEINWLMIPPQKLRTIQSGGVFHDGLNVLGPLRSSLRWYPDGMWCYLLACQWRRIDQEEPFVARCGHVGDELGSRIVAVRQLQEIMRLCFLMDREYAPYTKWFGTAFARLPSAETLSPLLNEVLVQTSWQERESALNRVYLNLANIHNTLGLTEYVAPEITPFHDRPYLVPHSARFVEALMRNVDSPMLRSLPRPIGAIHQFTDSTDIACWPEAWERLSNIYR